MKNTKYLKEHNLYKAHEQFMRLSEAYVALPEESLEEAGEDPNAQDGAGQDMPMDGGMGQDPSMGAGGMPQDPSMDGGMPQGMPADGGGLPQGDGQQEPQMDGGMDAMPMGGGVPQDPMADQGAPLDDEDDGDVIDIDALTKSEEKLDAKQDKLGRDFSRVDRRIEKLMDALETFQSALDNNNEQIEALKAEFEKRNPTQTEKLNLRSLDSYPFNVKPNDYWAQKAAEGGYDVYSDNTEPTTREYEITNNDVDDVDDSVANTFFTVDDDDIQTLDKIFRL